MAELVHERFRPRDVVTLQTVRDQVATPGNVLGLMNARSCGDGRKAHNAINLVSSDQYQQFLNSSIDPHQRRMVNYPEGNRDKGYVNLTVHDEQRARTFGSSMGDVIIRAVLFPALTPRQNVMLQAGWEESQGRHFNTHGDDHTDVGCGIIKLAMGPRSGELFGIPGIYVQEALRIARGMSEINDPKTDPCAEMRHPQELSVLEGPHNEPAFYEVWGDGSTVRSNGFRDDRYAHIQMLENQAWFLQGIDGRLTAFLEKYQAFYGQPERRQLERYLYGIRSMITPHALQETAIAHRNATAGVLAPDVPKFRVDLLGDNVKVSPLGQAA